MKQKLYWLLLSSCCLIQPVKTESYFHSENWVSMMHLQTVHWITIHLFSKASNFQNTGCCWWNWMRMQSFLNMNYIDWIILASFFNRCLEKCTNKRWESLYESMQTSWDNYLHTNVLQRWHWYIAQRFQLMDMQIFSSSWIILILRKKSVNAVLSQKASS